MNVPCGTYDEGFEGLCSFHGTSWRVIVEGYTLEEILAFVTEYLHELEHVSKRIWDVKEEDGVFGIFLKGALT